jgi:hypothetical protein
MSCSVSRTFQGVKEYAAVVPPVVPHKGRTSTVERFFGVRGSQAIGLRIRDSQERGNQSWAGLPTKDLVLVQKIKPRARLRKQYKLNTDGAWEQASKYGLEVSESSVSKRT